MIVVIVLICSISSFVTGLIVARLKGKIVRVCESLLPNEKVDANTIIGDKLEKPESQTLQDSDGWPIKDSYYEIVLRSSLQCLPMVKFNKALIGHNAGIECIRFLRNSLELILNERFNEGLLISDLCNTPLIGNATLTVPAFGSSHPQFNISRGRRTIGMAGGQPAQQMTTTQSVLWGPQQTIGTTRSAYAGTTGAFGSNPSPFGGVATGSVFGGGNVPNAAPFSIGQFGLAPSAGAAFVQAKGSTKLRGRPNSDILASFYQTYNPSKVNQVGTILRKYAGREKQMFLALSKKYKVDPSMFGVSAAQPKAGFGNSAGFGVATPGTGFGSSTGGFGLIAQTGGFGALASSTATGFGGSTQSSSFGPTAPFATSPTHNTPTSTLHYIAPKSLSKSIPSNALIAPPSDCNMDDDCVICHERLKTSSCVALKICNHVFHHDCIQMAFQSKSQCPTCRVPVGAPQGKSPSGTMSVSVNPVRCSGFQCDTLVISYNIPAARQLSYHDNPGVTHGSKVAAAYVPNNEDGVNLLKRLKFAFKHGLTFTVGTSMTSGKTDQCTW